MKKNKFLFFVLLMLVCLQLCNGAAFVVHANDGDAFNAYVVYDENHNYLFEKSQIFVGDMYVSKDFKKYEIVEVNEQLRIGIAKFLKQLTKPKVSISPTPSPIVNDGRTIGLYCSHNDESYEPTDGYYTIYGKGGIHDVANALKTVFENSGVKVVFNETLHLPHDGGAYSRSSVTAKNLLKNNELNALFDIHRDGVSRSYYATTVNGVERSKIRIVVGKANPNMEINENFALYLASVADTMYPWLISDIYYATGHYNQGLFEKALLFEMGTYLIEKELVVASLEPLVHTINTALFHTTVNNETGELEIGGQVTEHTPLIDDALVEIAQTNKEQPRIVAIVYVALVLVVLFMVLETCIVLYQTFVLKR